MSADLTIKIPVSVQRVLALVLGAGIFLGVASVVRPHKSGAGTPDVTPAVQMPGNNAGSRAVQHRRSADVMIELLKRTHPQGWPVLGMLEGKEYWVVIYGSKEGPRYTIFDLNGRLLQADLPADEVYRAYPGLDIQGMQFGTNDGGTPGAPLMIADPKD